LRNVASNRADLASSRSTIVGLYGAVLTADIVRQASVGASLKATLDRFIGTLGGAVWSVRRRDA